MKTKPELIELSRKLSSKWSTLGSDLNRNCQNLHRPLPRLDLEMKSIESRDKSSRGNASQFFIAGELCRRGYSAVITLGNTPNVDILCSNQQGTRFAHIQVKTFVLGGRTCRRVRMGSGNMKVVVQGRLGKKWRNCFHELRWSRYPQTVQRALCGGRARL